jgi:hypothetical protein
MRAFARKLLDLFLRARRNVGFVFSELAVTLQCRLVPRRQAVFLDKALVAGERAVFAGFDPAQRLVRRSKFLRSRS